MPRRTPDHSLSVGQRLRLRIRVVDPPHAVRFRVQRGARELQPPVRSTRRALTFEFDVRVGKRPTGEPDFLGEFAQGPPAGRFVYVNSGTLAGQPDSCWTRRAKVSLTDITWDLVESALASNGLLEMAFAGTGSDGGPTCASVKHHSGWRVVKAKAR